MFHISELFHSTWTGRHLPLVMNHVNMKVRGAQTGAVYPMLDSIRSHPPFTDERDEYVLFPADDAIPAAEIFQSNITKKPVRIYVPDGNWNQAHRMIKRESIFFHKKFIKIEGDAGGKLRKRNKPGQISTFAAVASLLCYLENDEVCSKLKNYYETLKRTIDKSKGR